MDLPSEGEIRSTYDRIAASYAAARSTPYPEVLTFLDRLPSGAHLLDLGCGHGRHAGPSLERGHHVIGIDISQSLIRIASRDLPGVDWAIGSGRAIPLKRGSVDACICIAVIHHIPTRADRVLVLREIGRVLQPGARVLVSVWDREQPRFRDATSADLEVAWPLPDGTRVPRFYHVFAEGELESLVIDAGLHGERFFRSRGNRFGEARNDG